MAKKFKEEAVPTSNSVPNRDIIQRLNYMYQASAYLQSLQLQRPPPSANFDADGQPKAQTASGKGKAGGILKRKTVADLAQIYVRSMKVVGQRTTVKIDPTVKRSICKGCDTALIPGTTVSTRVEKLPSHGQAVIYTCLNCKTKRRIPAPPATSAGSLSDMLKTVATSNPMGSTLQTIPSPQVHGAPPVPGKRSRKRRAVPVPRQPPLFARTDAGHVVFRGSERLVDTGRL